MKKKVVELLNPGHGFSSGAVLVTNDGGKYEMGVNVFPDQVRHVHGGILNYRKVGGGRERRSKYPK